MVINVHAGHNPDGKKACGACGLIKESTEARKVKELVIKKLKALGHTVYDCTVNNGTDQTDVLKKIVAKCNAHKADLDVSIHFNAGAADSKGNGVSAGTEILIYSDSGKAREYAARTLKEICRNGFRNRGIKTSKSLYVLNHTKAPAMLVECCFVDDRDDVKLYSPETMADAIVSGITGKETRKSMDSTGQYRVQCGAFKTKASADKLRKELEKAGFKAVVVSGISEEGESPG